MNRVTLIVLASLISTFVAEAQSPQYKPKPAYKQEPIPSYQPPQRDSQQVEKKPKDTFLCPQTSQSFFVREDGWVREASEGQLGMASYASNAPHGINCYYSMYPDAESDRAHGYPFVHKTQLPPEWKNCQIRADKRGVECFGE